MGAQTIVHGRVHLKGDFESSRGFIKTLIDDDKFPWIRTEMFSLGATEKPFFYDEPVIGFAADYKNLEYGLDSFVLKFENILRNIDFYTAKIEMETEFVGTYNFFWKSKNDQNSAVDIKDCLIETDEWYFGYGYRSRWGDLNVELREEHIFDIEFEYPIKFDEKTLVEFSQVISLLSIGERGYVNPEISNLDKLRVILTYCFINKMIRYGFEGGKGFWVEKLKDIDFTTYNTNYTLSR